MKRNRTASTRKRWLSLTLAIVLLFCPFPALAAEETPAEQTGDLGLAGKVKLGYHITWNQGKPLETGQTLVDLNYQFTLREAGSVADNARYWRIFVGDTAVFDCVYEVAFGTGSLSTGDTKCLSANAAVSGYVVTYTHTLTLDPGVTTFTLPALKIHYAAEPDALEEPSDTAVKDFTGTPITIAPPGGPGTHPHHRRGGPPLPQGTASPSPRRPAQRQGQWCFPTRSRAKRSGSSRALPLPPLKP